MATSLNRQWCAYCRRRGHCLYVSMDKYIVIICIKSRLFGRCYENHDFLTSLFSARLQVPPGNGTFILLCRNLWDLDTHLVPDKDYKIFPRLVEGVGQGDIYGKNGQMSNSDGVCPITAQPLFDQVRQDVFEMPLFKHFISLLDICGILDENIGNKEIMAYNEQDKFLEAVMQTFVAKRLHVYLLEKQIVGDDAIEMKEKLHAIWFKKDKDMHSAFDRVFVGNLKVKKNKEKVKPEGFVSGIHNWVRLYMLEKEGYIQYRGVTANKTPSDKQQIMNIEFVWDGIINPVGSTFFGTTPAFEMCLYTAVFLSGCKEGHTYVRLGPYNVDLYCPSNILNCDTKLTTCYPVHD
ncbi:uridylate-specific endoribonuclease B-like [Glandiceps talaboti]